MGGKGGSADQSGMYAALASAQAAQESYALGSQQLDWAKSVWNQEQPLVNQAEQGQLASQQLTNQFAQQQYGLYTNTYAPLQQAYAQQAQQWASPGQQQVNAGAAMTMQANAGEAARNSATQQLESFGINPGSTRFAGLDIGSRTAQAAATAGAGTQAVQATKLQGLGLESGAINTGMGLPNQTAGLAATGTGAGSAAAGAAQGNLATGSSAMTAPTNWFNTGAANMNTYVNAVNGYNQAQLGYAQVGAMQGMGMGALAGGLLGMLEGGGPTDPSTYSGGNGVIPSRNPGSATPSPGAVPGHAIPPGGTPGGVIPSHASPSQGRDPDDVPARLTVGEFVMPKDVVAWKGQEHFYKEIDKQRAAAEQAKQRTDIGGQAGYAAPAAPAFTSRPVIPPQQHARGV